MSLCLVLIVAVSLAFLAANPHRSGRCPVILAAVSWPCEAGKCAPFTHSHRYRPKVWARSIKRMQHSGSTRRKQPIASLATRSGILVETICTDEGTNTTFVIGARKEWRTAETWEEDGTTYVPISPCNNLVRHGALTLPSALRPYENDHVLFAAITKYIARYVTLSDEDRAIAASYVLLSWVYDAFSELPYLRFRGDYGTGKTRALITLGAIVYKGFFASGASTVSPIFHTLDAFGPTLLLDEADFRFTDEKAELVKILNNGNARGIPVLRTQITPQREFDPRAFTVFGPKIIAMRGEYADRALESRFFTIEMRPGTSGRAPINLPEAHRSDAEALRSHLLAYRFARRFETTVDSSLVDPRLEARMNQVLLPLLSVAPSPDVRALITARAAAQQRRTIEDRSFSFEGRLVALVEELIGGASGEPLSVGVIAKHYAERHQREHLRPITSRLIGSMLRRLGIATYKRHGVFVVATEQTPTLEALKVRYGVAPLSSLPRAGQQK